MTIIDQLTELKQESIQRGIPVIGKEKSSWLLEKVKVLQPKNVLELGTANGYSGIILGSEGAKLITIEQDFRIAQEAKDHFKKFNINATVIVGDAVTIIKRLNQNFDLIFIDFSKKKYLQILDDCLRLTEEGSHLIADNIFMEGCRDFKEVVLNHPLLQTEIIKIKDGLSFSKRK